MHELLADGTRHVGDLSSMEGAGGLYREWGVEQVRSDVWRAREDDRGVGGAKGTWWGTSLTAVSKYNVSTSNTASIYRLTDV